MKSLEQKIIVRCKNCGWRIFDKVTMTTGVIELKCPNCHRVVEVDLSLRKGMVKYRLVKNDNRANNYNTVASAYNRLFIRNRFQKLRCPSKFRRFFVF